MRPRVVAVLPAAILALGLLAAPLPLFAAAGGDAAVVAGLPAGGTPAGGTPAAGAQSGGGAAQYASPDQAVEALVEAVRSDDAARILVVLGQDAIDLVESGDPVADKNERAAFVRSFETRHALNVSGDTATLTIGEDDWTLPFPLRHTAGGWQFDVAAGADEILDRRIGANELVAQQVAFAYVAAQNEYAMSWHDGHHLHAYAARLTSTPGHQDGLYWPSAEGQPASPFAKLMAEAEEAGYQPRLPGEQRQPYFGYFYRVLKGQGPHAPGGAYDYMVKDTMLGGFALIAYPASYGVSGVKSFIINQDGVLYEKDLGVNSDRIAAGISRFDPDKSWQKVPES